MDHEHEWGTIERGRIYCMAVGCSASHPITDAEAADLIWGDPAKEPLWKPGQSPAPGTA